MKNRIFLALDLILAIAVVVVAFTARYEGLNWWPRMARVAIAYFAVAVSIKIGLFLSVGLYRRLWRYASVADLEMLLVAGLLGTVTSFVVGLVILPGTGLTATRVPIGILVMDSALFAAAIALPRLLLRVVARRTRSRRSSDRRRGPRREGDEARRVLIAGAGEAGGMIARELIENRQLGLVPVGFIDDNSAKHGHELHGIPVLGPLPQLSELVTSYAVGEVIIALPSARGRAIRDIVRASASAGVPNRTVPGLFEILSGAKAVSALRPIQIQDLLRREPIQTNLDQVASLVTGKTVLVTGAGGSIGSELCRQLASLLPERIVAVGRGENSIFELVEELRFAYPTIPVRPVIVDVRDAVRLRAVFAEFLPYSVFHAAAHKHVPLMELNPTEAISNNVLGTLNVVRGGTAAVGCRASRPDLHRQGGLAPERHGRDEAHRRGNHCAAPRSDPDARYLSVRFGNVLGSRGSVVPSFKQQIAAGRSAHRYSSRDARFFMTIPEAVHLVLQAGGSERAARCSCSTWESR